MPEVPGRGDPSAERPAGDLAARLQSPLPTGFVRTVTTLHADESCDLRAPWWGSALVVVVSESVLVTTPDGESASFGAGSALSLAGMQASSLRNVAQQAAVMVCVTRSVDGAGA